MGTLRLVVDAPANACPVDAPLDRLPELLADKTNRLWLTSATPVPRRSPCSSAPSASTRWRWRT